MQFDRSKKGKSRIYIMEATAVVSWLKEDLEMLRDNFPDMMIDQAKEETEGIIHELRMIEDLLRDKKMEEGSRLNYLIDDIVEMASYAVSIIKINRVNWNTFPITDVQYIRSWLAEAKPRLGVDGMENVGDDEDVDDEDLVGLEKDVKLLLRKAVLNEPEFYLRTSLITGMVGIGKTALAGQLYSHSDVVGRFERRAWVRVSPGVTHKEILMKLIQQLGDSQEQLQGDSSLEKMDNDSLKQMLHQHLEGTRYLIVLDDLPKLFQMRFLFRALPYDGMFIRLPSLNWSCASDLRFNMIVGRLL